MWLVSGATGPMAHTPNRDGDWHPLVAHLQGVADLARRFGDPLGLGELAYWAGLWHDVGKASCIFQDYLTACADGDSTAPLRFRDRDHKRAGMSLAAAHSSIRIAFAIDGHHGGLPALAHLRGRFPKPGEFDDVIAAVSALMDGRLLPPGPLTLTELSRGEEEMRVRFLASCLVDADFLDTEGHFDPEAGGMRASTVLSALQANFDQAMTRLRAEAPDTAVNRARAAYFDHVVSRAAASTTGLYRMSGPTGVGKTLAGLAAAMAHAGVNGQHRVVVALPYMTVTEQTADVYRRVLGSEAAVVEHHSGVSEERDTMWRRLAAENWDAPAVVTTVVQLFESLFDRRPSKIRKLHNLAGAVVVIDEAQTIPAGILEPVVDALDWLVCHAGTSIVLMTATQPAFDLIGPFRNRHIVDWGTADVPGFAGRVRWKIEPQPVPVETLAADLGSQPASLAIVNTVADAVALSRALDPYDPTHLYLSTRLCREHRRSALHEIFERLRAERACRVVATQLVEAGIDLDFPHVVRVLGPLPSLAQAAGRCNRNGRLPEGEIRVLELVGGTLPPGEYRIGTQQTAAASARFGDAFDPEDPRVLRVWFEAMYRSASLDVHEVNVARRGLDFPETARRFRVIDNGGVTVVVPWGSREARVRVEDITTRIASGGVLARADWRFLSGYTVDLRHSVFRQATSLGLLQVIEENVLARWIGTYDDRLGVVIDQATELEAMQW
jgi:CRISPR-associated endonuclease/helicase Cas3